MAKSREQKEKIVEKVKNIFDSAKSIVFVNFHGLSVDAANEMRGTLKEGEVDYYVAKKSLTRLALKDSSVKGDVPELDGELAIAYGSDPTSAPRLIYEFQKKFDGAVSIIGGVFENKFLGKDEMTEIAEIPDMKTLRGMFVNVINSPIQGFAVALNAIAEKKGE